MAEREDKAAEKNKSRNKKKLKGGVEADSSLNVPRTSTTEFEDRLQELLENSKRISREILGISTVLERTREEGASKAKEIALAKAVSEARKVCRDRYSVNIGENGDVYPVGYRRGRVQDAMDSCLSLECQESFAAPVKNTRGDRGVYATSSKEYPFEGKITSETMTFPSEHRELYPSNAYCPPYRNAKSYMQDKEEWPERKESHGFDRGEKAMEKPAQGGIHRAQSSHEHVERWLEEIRHHCGREEWNEREEGPKERAGYYRNFDYANEIGMPLRELLERHMSAGRVNTSSKVDASNNLATYRSSFNVSDPLGRGGAPPIGVDSDVTPKTERTRDAQVSCPDCTDEEEEERGGGEEGGEEGAKEEGAVGGEGEGGDAEHKLRLKTVIKRMFICCSSIPKEKGEEKEKETDFENDKEEEKEEVAEE